MSFCKPIAFAFFILILLTMFSCKSGQFTKRKYTHGRFIECATSREHVMINGKKSIASKATTYSFSEKHISETHRDLIQTNTPNEDIPLLSKNITNSPIHTVTKTKLGKTAYLEKKLNTKPETKEAITDPVAIKLKSALQICVSVLIICAVASLISGISLIVAGSFIMEDVLAFSILAALIDLFIFLIYDIIQVIKW